LGRTLSEAPLWAKRVGTFLVGAAAVAGGVAGIVPLLESRSSPPPSIQTVNLGPPEWSAHDLTLGGYLAWQQRESGSLGLRALGDDGTAQVLNLGAAGAEVKPTVVRLARYASSLSEVDATSTQPTPVIQALAPEKNTTTTTGGHESGTTGIPSDSGPSSSPADTTPSTTTLSTTTVPSKGTVSTGPISTGPTSTGPTSTGHTSGSESNSGVSLRTEVLREAKGHLNSTETSRLRQKVQGQEAIIRNPELQQSDKVLRICQGVAYGGCAPEAAIESQHESTITATPEPSPTGGQSGEAARASGESTSRHPTQSQRELLEIAGGARLGSAVDANLIPTLMTAGMSDEQRVRVASVLGDAVSLEVHTRGWIGQQLWLTWTMYEKQDGYWNPSSREYLIDHAEAYVVPTASNDEGILTFWFPIPKQQGDYEVRYFIRAPRSGYKLASGKTHSFRS
jgi:hypothetical protein